MHFLVKSLDLGGTNVSDVGAKHIANTLVELTYFDFEKWMQINFYKKIMKKLMSIVSSHIIRDERYEFS